MELRVGQIPAEVQYVLDCSVDYGHLTGGAHMAIWLFGEVGRILAIHDDPREGKGWAGQSDMLVRMERYGQSIIRRADSRYQAALRGSTTVSLCKMLAEWGEYIARATYEDAIWGGAMYHRHETRANRIGEVDRKLERRLHSPKVIKRLCRYQHSDTGFKHLVRVWDCAGRSLAPVEDRHFDIIAEAQAQQQERRREHERDWLRRHTNKERAIGVERAELRKQRRVVVKAAAVAASILGAATVSAFARGEPVVLATPSIVLKVSLAGSIYSEGHGALNVSLHGTDDTFLSRMCIYQKLPVFDQLASMALFVQAGEIKEIINTGNLFSVAPQALAHPLLQAKPKPQRVAVADDELERGFAALMDGALDSGRFDIDGHETKRQMCQRYEDEWADVYRERIFLDVLGRAGPRAWSMFKEFRSAGRMQ